MGQLVFSGHVSLIRHMFVLCLRSVMCLPTFRHFEGASVFVANCVVEQRQESKWMQGREVLVRNLLSGPQ